MIQEAGSYPCMCRRYNGPILKLSDPQEDCEWCNGTGTRVHPKMKETMYGDSCPACGFTGDLDEFEVLWSDHGCVFCPECTTEIGL